MIKQKGRKGIRLGVVVVVLLLLTMLPGVGVSSVVYGAAVKVTFSDEAINSYAGAAEEAFNKGYTRSYFVRQGMPDADWCGYFAGWWCMNHSQIRNVLGRISIGESGYCMDPATWSLKKNAGTFYVLSTGSYTKPYKELYYSKMCRWGGSADRVQKVNSFTPQRGDMVLFDWGSDGTYWHVGIMIDSDTFIDGNSKQGGYTTLQKRSVSAYNYAVIGFFRFNSEAQPPSPIPEEYSFPTRDLYYVPGSPMTGSDVRWIQTFLNKCGYAVNVNGTFGAETKAAVELFQRANGLVVDGEVGPETRGRMKEKWPELPTSVLSMKFNANGGSISSTTYSADSTGMVLKSGSAFLEKWKYDYGHPDGLYAPSTFGLTRSGYTFCGWSLSKDGSSGVFAQKETILSQDIDPDLKNGSKEVELFAVWEPNTYTIVYDANGGEGTMESIVCTYDVEETLAANAFTRADYAFNGWNTSADGTGNSYADQAGVMNLISTDEGSITLYAQWKETLPDITLQPADQAIAVGEKVVFQTSVSGAGLKYQWQVKEVGASTWRNCTATGNKTSTYSFTVRPAYHDRQYRCKITNPAGTVYTGIAKLIVLPDITLQPESQTMMAGDTVSFKVTASGAAPLKYQWEVDKNDGAGWVNSTGSGNRTNRLHFNVRPAYDGRIYRCKVTDVNGNTVISNVVVLTVRSAPAISTQPRSQTVSPGETARFTVTASGTRPLRYQWQVSTDKGVTWKNSTGSGNKTETLHFTAKTSFSGRKYRCIVTNGEDQTVTSSVAVLTVR